MTMLSKTIRVPEVVRASRTRVANMSQGNHWSGSRIEKEKCIHHQVQGTGDSEADVRRRPQVTLARVFFSGMFEMPIEKSSGVTLKGE